MFRNILMTAALLGAGLMIGRSSLQPMPVVKAQSTSACTMGSLMGSYGYNHTGFFYDSQGNFGVYGSVGRFAADGNGGLTAVDTINVDGTVVQGRKLTGVYTINPDCTGNLTFTSVSSGKVVGNWDLNLVNAGKEVNMVESDTDTIFSGVAKQQ